MASKIGRKYNKVDFSVYPTCWNINEDSNDYEKLIIAQSNCLKLFSGKENWFP